MYLELEEIQGYVLDNYDPMLYSRYDLIQISDASNASDWLKNTLFRLTVADQITRKMEQANSAMNLAITAQGLRALGMTEANLNSFTMEFREGMVTPHRTRLLGDFGESSPEKWLWGSPNSDEVHFVLLIFGRTQNDCDALCSEMENSYEDSGLHLLRSMPGQTLEGNKEHFGFRDGISQPNIIGSAVEGPKHNMVKPGEFIMGYPNEYGVLPESPKIEAEQGDTSFLPSDAGGSGKKDLGRNGTYLVLRQMDQDVNAFWEYMNAKTRNEDGTLNIEASIKLAAQMVGRWPSGAPLTKFPDRDPGGLSNDNDFGYHDADADGSKCPFGSHLRRSNPRDSFEDNGKNQSWKLTRKHRIIRRARLYGEPIIGTPTNHTPQGEVGLIFHAFNADISRQFEFIQYTWANSPKVKNLYNDPDPIIGVSADPNAVQDQNFTIQGCPINKTVAGLQRFVTIRGGAYCFFPSISALRYLSTLQQ